MKDSLDFSNNGHPQKITIRNTCCSISTSVHDVFEYVFQPVICDLVSEISYHATQIDISYFHLDNVFLIDKLLDAQPKTYEFLEKIFMKSLANVMNIGVDTIKLPKDMEESALKGIELYGKNPDIYTERVARKTYMTTVEAFEFQFFEENAINETILEEDDEDSVYNVESKNAFRGDTNVELFYEPAYNPSDRLQVGPFYQNLFIQRGTKITEHNQTYGIRKRFFAERECLVYVCRRIISYILLTAY